jgi:DNA-binding response OmpR family regulator
MTPAGTQWRIMIVDDELELLSAACEALRQEFEVLGAVNGIDALEKLDRYEPDLIVLDVMMAGVNGIDTCRAIRRNVRFGDTPILFLSGQDESAYRESGESLGVTSFLRKPVKIPELLEACRAAIRDRRRRTPPPKQYRLADLVTPPPGSESGTPAPAAGGSDSQAPTLATVPDKKPAPAAAVARPFEPVPDVGPIPPRILVIDDERAVVRQVIEALSVHFEVIGMTDPVSAIYTIIRHQPDVLILDATMPRLSGYQLSQLLRLNRNLRRVRIVFLSSNASPQARDYAHKLGAADYVVKPFSNEELRRRVYAVVDAPDFEVREKAMAIEELRRAEAKDPTPSLLL